MMLIKMPRYLPLAAGHLDSLKVKYSNAAGFDVDYEKNGTTMIFM